MHEMHIYYIFIAPTDHKSNDFQNSKEGENIMNDVTQPAKSKKKLAINVGLEVLNA